MKVKVLKRTEDELRVEVEGAGHTLCNLVQKRILEDKNVDLGGYDVPHPLASSAMIYVRVKGKVKPEQVLKDAVGRSREFNREFGKELDRALRKA